MSEHKDFVPQAVRCPGCGQSYHQTTPEYDPDRCAHGRMFKLMPAYGPNGANWTTFPYDESVRHGDLLCPGCGAPYTNGGNSVTVRDIVVNKADRAALEAEQAENDEEIAAHRLAVEAAANDALNAEEALKLAESASEEAETLPDGEDVTERVEEVKAEEPVAAPAKKSIRIGGK